MLVMEYDLGFMTLMSAFFKNSSWVLWLLLYLQSCSLLVTASDSKHINGKILSSSSRFLYQALTWSDPFTHKVPCNTSRDFSVSSGQHFCVCIIMYLQSCFTFFHWLFQICCNRIFFNIFFLMQLQKGCRVVFFFKHQKHIISFLPAWF